MVRALTMIAALLLLLTAPAAGAGPTDQVGVLPERQGRMPDEREEFVQLFADLLERTYISPINDYGGEKIRYVGESADGELATVRARIQTKTGTQVSVESRLPRCGSG